MKRDVDNVLPNPCGYKMQPPKRISQQSIGLNEWRRYALMKMVIRLPIQLVALHQNGGNLGKKRFLKILSLAGACGGVES